MSQHVCAASQLVQLESRNTSIEIVSFCSHLSNTAQGFCLQLICLSMLLSRSIKLLHIKTWTKNKEKLLRWVIRFTGVTSYEWIKNKVSTTPACSNVRYSFYWASWVLFTICRWFSPAAAAAVQHRLTALVSVTPKHYLVDIFDLILLTTSCSGVNPRECSSDFQGASLHWPSQDGCQLFYY